MARVLVVRLLLGSLCFDNAASTDYELHPRVDSSVQGLSNADYSNCSDLAVKEIYKDQTNQTLIHRSFLEFDLTMFSGHVTDVSTLHLWLNESERGAAIRICPAKPFTVPISWQEQPSYDCDEALGEVRYLPGLSNVHLDILPYVQKQLGLGNNVIAFALIAATPGFYTTFRSMEYENTDQRPLLRIQGFEPPFNSNKFKKVLSKSRLQWPLTTPDVGLGDFLGYASHHFQLLESKYLQFQVRGEHHRCMLRHDATFSTATSTEKSIKAHLYLSKPAYPTSDLAIIQMDSEQPTSQELLGSLIQIGWRSDHDKKHDHIWAKVQTSSANETIMLPLFPRPEAFFHLEVAVASGRLSVKYNDETVPLSPELESYDVSYWKDMHHNAFQVGILLNDGAGPASVVYDSIEIVPEGLEKDNS